MPARTRLHQTITPARKGTTVWHTALIGHFAGSAGSPTAPQPCPDCRYDLRYESAATMTALSWDPAETWAGALATATPVLRARSGFSGACATQPATRNDNSQVRSGDAET